MNVVVGISGSIAAYKSALVVRGLLSRNLEVRVCMTPSATRFVGPSTFEGLTGSKTVLSLWDGPHPGEEHVALGQWADLFLVVPATQNLIARARMGMADDMVLATLACTTSPVLFAPAMHSTMWLSAATQQNVQALISRGAHFVGPVEGPLASGDVGIGRLANPEEIVRYALDLLQPPARHDDADLTGFRLLISAGPTLEDLDPVRFLGNRSTGKMGFALAKAAARRGASVCLVHGPVHITPPPDVEAVPVRSAHEMLAAMQSRFETVDAVVLAAAVADYRPAEPSPTKIKKSDGDLNLRLIRNPDIAIELSSARKGSSPLLVGFALETHNLIERAKEKLRRKKMDLIVANHTSHGFGEGITQLNLIDKQDVVSLPRMTKEKAAESVLDALAERWRTSLSSA
ncbi:MAG: bifunctional phosphopantothenoylcysteine decarboxylase/phosphopantothenate--cysteine ligase CoaBC [Myxococcota bacterium]